MKKIVTILLLLAIFISFVPLSIAEDNFKVSQRILQSQEDELTMDVVMPIFEGFTGADKVNEKVFNIYLDAIGDANATATSLKAMKDEIRESGEEVFSAIASLDMNYDYAVIGDVLSIQLNIYSYAGGAHGANQLINITSNMKTGEIYEFKDLFKSGVDYKARITEFILDEIEKDDVWYFPEYKETIANKNGSYEFFIDGDKLVIYFGIYDISAYAYGIRYFDIDSDEIKDLLKDEVYDSIKNGNERGNISFNGKDINSQRTILSGEDSILLPLRAVAETLGYKVDWNMDDGPILTSDVTRFVKDDVDKVVVVDGTSYVPINYFKDILGENVSFGITHSGKIIIRTFSKEGQENHIFELMKKVESQITSEDAIRYYAESVKSRNGASQYFLMIDQLREEKYTEFREMGFVTGTSSPWVDSYEITQLEDNLYQIKFTLKTSVPTDSITTIVNIELVEDGQYIKIKSIEELR